MDNASTLQESAADATACRTKISTPMASQTFHIEFLLFSQVCHQTVCHFQCVCLDRQPASRTLHCSTPSSRHELKAPRCPKLSAHELHPLRFAEQEAFSCLERGGRLEHSLALCTMCKCHQ